MSATVLTFPPREAVHGYAGLTLKAVRDLPIEEQMEEIRIRIVVGEYADIPEQQLNVLRRVWELLYERLYRFTTVH